MPRNMVCSSRLFRYILLLSVDLPIYRSIHIIAKRAHSHSSPAGQILRDVHFSVFLAQFHTNKWNYGSFRVPKNIFRFHNTVPLLEDQNSYCAKEWSAHSVPAPSGNNSRRIRNRLLFYFRSTRLLRVKTVPVQKPPLHIVYDNTAPAHNNIAAVHPRAFRPQSSSGIFSNFDPDPRQTSFYG